MKRLFEAYEEGLRGDDCFSYEDFRISLWKFWKAMKEKLWE
jgi:hypothetical protein